MPSSMFTDAYKVLVNTLVEARKAAGLTQTDLAKRMGKGQKYVSVIETGIRRLDLIEFIAFADALSIPSRDLFDRVINNLPNLED